MTWRRGHGRVNRGHLEWRRLAASAVVGLLFGAVATLLNVPTGGAVLDDSPQRVASLVVNSGAAWAGTGVLGGWLVGSVVRGLVGGPLTLVAAVVAYYLLGALAGSEHPGGSGEQIILFSVVALVVGPALGAVGGAVRRRDLLGLVAALVAPVGVGAERVWRSSIIGLPPDPARPAADVILIALALVGTVVAMVRWWRTRPAAP